MTQEDKARAYDEALERAKEELSVSHINSDSERQLYRLFPELKESEDERIRNGLIALLKFGLEDGSAIAPGFNETKEQALTWLEKQGKKPQGKSALEAINEVEVDNQNCVKTNGKVEPKFEMEKGKWYVCDTSRYTDFIVGKAYYCPKNGMLKPNENAIARYVARDCFHLWTIEDAKDGDVLQLGIVTAIFRKYIGNEHCKCYCSVCNGEFEIPSQEGEDSRYGCFSATPATKEQRDFLFTKMKEAGYEWDAEKKELRKIEQKSTWSAEDERIRQCLILDQEEALDDVCNDKCGHSEIISDLKEMYRERINWLKSIKKRIGEKNEHTNLHD